jgi:hypothetical protein
MSLHFKLWLGAALLLLVSEAKPRSLHESRELRYFVEPDVRVERWYPLAPVIIKQSLVNACLRLGS